MPAKYRIKHTPEIGEGRKGDIVYQSVVDDFNLSSSISQMTGQLYVTVTHNPDGTYPSFAILAHYLEELND